MSAHKSLVLVVHGIGEQKKGDALKDTVKDFFPLIRNRIDPAAVVTVKPLQAEGPAEATFKFRGPHPKTAKQDGVERVPYEITVREVWWAQSFNPPALGPLVLGLIKGICQYLGERGERQMKPWEYVWRPLWEVIGRLVLGVAKILFVPFFLVALAVALVCGIPFCPWARFPVIRSVVPVFKRIWTKLPENSIRRLLRRLSDAALGFRAFRRAAQDFLMERISEYQPVIVHVAIVSLSPLIILVLFLLWVLESPFPASKLPSWLTGAHRYLVKIVSAHWGDMWLYLYQPWEASRIRARFEEEFEEVTRDLQSSDIEELDSVMVVAHSMGSVVAYEALTGARLAPAVARFRGHESGKLCFVSIGSALNLAWDTAPKSEAHRLHHPLPRAADWLNLWTRYDPVGGEALRVPPNAFQSRRSVWAGHYHVPLSQREVVNQMDLFADHTAYWNNAAEVVAPLFNVLTAHTLVNDLVMDPQSRRSRVRVLALAKGLAWLTAPVVFVLALRFTDLNVDDLRWVAPALEWLGDKISDSDVPDFVFDAARNVWSSIACFARNVASTVWGAIGWPFEKLGDFVADTAEAIWDTLPHWAQCALDWVWPDDPQPDRSLAAGLEAGLVAWVAYSTVIKWAWDLWDTSVKYNRPSAP